VLLGPGLPADAATDDTVVFGVPDARRIGKSEPTSADGAEGFGLPYSQILRDTEPPYENMFRDIRAGGRITEKIGPGDASVQANLFTGPRMNLPLASRGTRPEDAEFKLGRFYLDLEALSASLLYSDNVDLTEEDRKDAVIGIIRLTGTVLFQITDNLRLAARGTLVWLPFRGEFGVAGFGVGDPLMEFETMPLFQTQLTLDRQVGGWDVEAIDELSARNRRYGASYGLDFFDGVQFDEEDRAGRYVVRDNTPGTPGYNNDRFDNSGDNYVEARNLVGVSASRLLPTVTRLEFGGYHANYWYNGTDDPNLPNSRDTVYAMLESERETLRFKPYLRYRASHYDYEEGWGEEVRIGVQGPATENLNLLGDVGYYWRTDTSHNTYLARLRLRHTFNPITYHHLEYYRGVTEPYAEITDALAYTLRHIFRDDLSGQIYASWSKFESSQTGDSTGEERRAAARLTYDLASHTSLRLSGGYVESLYDNQTAADYGYYHDYDEWIGRAEIFYRHTASLQTRLIYQYRDRHSDTPGNSYQENLVVLTVIKYF
jgi:hypothetical protein